MPAEVSGKVRGIMEKTALIIHGTEGNPEGNWFPWLKVELERKGWKVGVPEFPTPKGQSLENWLAAFDSAKEDLGLTSVLIGHSLGAAFALRLIQKRSLMPAGTFLASGFLRPIGNAHYDGLNATFLAEGFDWEIMRNRAGRVFCYSGDNDPYVPLELGIELAENIGTTPAVIRGGGHLNAEFGYKKFEALLGDVLSLERWNGKK